jgi:hypothetical protein
MPCSDDRGVEPAASIRERSSPRYIGLKSAAFSSASLRLKSAAI